MPTVKASSLMPMLEPVHLYRAYRECQRRPSGPLVGSTGWKALQREKAARLHAIATELRVGRWEPSSIACRDVVQYTGEVLPVSVPIPTDRVVFRALRNAIEHAAHLTLPIQNVYGHLHHRTRVDALRAISKHIKAGKTWITVAELPDSPPLTAKDLLREFIADGRFLALADRVDNVVGLMTPGIATAPTLGTLAWKSIDESLRTADHVRFGRQVILPDFAVPTSENQHARERLREAGAQFSVDSKQLPLESLIIWT